MVKSQTKPRLTGRVVSAVASLLVVWSLLTSPTSQSLPQLDHTHQVADGGSLPHPGGG